MGEERISLIEVRMKRFLLLVAYDGTDFHGYQIQPKARTVEGVLNQTLSEFLKEEIVTIGASRTDAGVHSYGNLAVFDSETTIPAEKLALALNTKLPEDVRIIKSLQVSSDFHPRKNVVEKTYEYHINQSEIELPTKRFYSYHVRKRLNLEEMKKAASLIEGRHDFTSFCSAKTDKEDKVREVYEVSIREEGEDIVISVRGNGFLYNMVRIIAGTLVKVGEGKLVPSEIPVILEKKDRTLAGKTLPPEGLFLKEIKYEV